MPLRYGVVVAALFASSFCAESPALTLFENDFNTDTTADWTINGGPTDEAADFFFDYSSVGIPAAPGGSGTRGLKMVANVTDGIFGGFSVSPTGQAFFGDYKVEFDLWQNYVGPLGAGGSGTTQLSEFGIGTAGNVSVWPGSGPKESIMFAATLDGGSASDYRAYSSAAPTGYQSGDPVYIGGSNNNSNLYYTNAFLPVSAPVAQTNLFASQTGSTDAGEISFEWRHVTIEVSLGYAVWYIDSPFGQIAIAGIDLSTVTLGGNNILFGHSDTNAGISADPNSAALNFTLIDNVKVTGTLYGDYNGDNVVDAADYTVWRDNEGQSVSLPNDLTAGVVDSSDYTLWGKAYGGAASPGPSLAIPEPTALVTLGCAVAAFAVRRRNNA